jgi:tetratricopeptide (TPR) repeat protein
MTHDFYEILQVHPNADQEMIETAYRRLLERYDAKRLEGAADELIEMARQKRQLIEQAYQTLHDPKRRKAYDAAQATQDNSKPLVAATTSEAALDYRPLPPAQGQVRSKRFNAQPTVTPVVHNQRKMASAARRPPAWFLPATLAGVVIAIVIGLSYIVTGGGGPQVVPTAVPTTAAAAPTAPLVDQFETFIPRAKQLAETNPNNAQSWIDYGNLLYDSAQIVRELEPDSQLYQQRIPRWQEAANAYRKALELEPNNWLVRADLATCLCFYGAGTNAPQTVTEGTTIARQAVEVATNAGKKDDPFVLRGLSYCLISNTPPQTDEAIKLWQRIVEVAPDQPIATEARNLIARYQQ